MKNVTTLTSQVTRHSYTALLVMSVVYEIEVGSRSKVTDNASGILINYSIDIVKSFHTLKEAQDYVNSYSFRSDMAKYDNPTIYIVENRNSFIKNSQKFKKSLYSVTPSGTLAKL